MIDLQTIQINIDPEAVISVEPSLKPLLLSEVLHNQAKTIRIYTILNIIIGIFNLVLLVYNLIKVFR